MNFQPNPELEAMVGRVYSETLSLDRGDLLPHAKIEELTGLVRYQGSWSSVIRKLVRRTERERGITLWPVRGCGYRLLPVDDQLTIVPEKRTRRALHQHTKTINSLTVINMKELSNTQMVLRAAVVSTARRQKKSALRERRIQNALFRKPVD